MLPIVELSRLGDLPFFLGRLFFLLQGFDLRLQLGPLNIPQPAQFQVELCNAINRSLKILVRHQPLRDLYKLGRRLFLDGNILFLFLFHLNLNHLLIIDNVPERMQHARHVLAHARIYCHRTVVHALP